MRGPVTATAQRIGDGGHRFEADEVLPERSEDLRRGIAFFEVHLDPAASAGNRERRAVGARVVPTIKSPVAQRFTEGGLDDRLAGGKSFVVERQMPHRGRLDQPLLAWHVRLLKGRVKAEQKRKREP